MISGNFRSINLLLIFYRCQKWKNILGFVGAHGYADITAEQSHIRIKICNLHFSANSFSNESKSRLYKGAFPSLFLPSNSEGMMIT